MATAFRFSPSATTFIALVAGLNVALYHVPLFSLAACNLDLSTFSGVLTLATLPVVEFLGSALLLIPLALVSQRILKPFCMLMALSNAVALYFLLTCRVVLDDDGQRPQYELAEGFYSIPIASPTRDDVIPPDSRNELD